MSKWYDFILKTFIKSLFTTGLNLHLMSDPKEDVAQAAKERLASKAAHWNIRC